MFGMDENDNSPAYGRQHWRMVAGLAAIFRHFFVTCLLND